MPLFKTTKLFEPFPFCVVAIAVVPEDVVIVVEEEEEDFGETTKSKAEARTGDAFVGDAFVVDLLFPLLIGEVGEEEAAEEEEGGGPFLLIGAMLIAVISL